ncbi:MAG: J domain-containing protein [Deltaproteobacteria bacterium]|nr:J domain-containing protein [Deltaproteobacteria bacterium]MCB9488114.1 J domain-containing protein [Deltaproteobacteria bacterium]
MAKRDYYDVLGVAKNADDKQIKSAYRKLARKYHPDFNKDDAEAEKNFKEVSEAYAVLSNKEARQKYDQFGHEQGPGHAGFDFSGFDFQNAQGNFRGFGQSFSGSGLHDILNDLFGGGGFGGGGARGFGGGRPRPVQGQTVTAEMHLDLMDVLHGAKKTVTLDGPGGPQRVSFTVPVGLKDGGKIRLRGKGLPGPGGGPAGDLIIHAHVRPHGQFAREGENLKTTVGVSIAEAVLGAKVPVQTPFGTTTISLPPGTQGGQTLRIAGKGVPRKSGKAGDLLVTVKIVVPKDVDEKSRELIKQFDLRNPVQARPAGAA